MRKVIPRLAESPQRLSLARMNNFPGTRPALSAKCAFVRSNRFPPVSCPRDFVLELEHWQNQIGTCYAALAGMMLATGVKDTEGVISGFEAFHRIVEITSEAFRGEELSDLEGLRVALDGKLVFKTHEVNVLRGLLHLRENFDDGTVKVVGNCAVGSAIFALIAMQHGYLAGEVHALDAFHCSAYFPGVQKTFEFDVNDGLALPDASLAEPLIVSSVFSFIPALIINYISAREQQVGFKCFPTARLREALACAEQVNPFYYQLYLLRAKILRANDEISQARHAEAHAAGIRTFRGQRIEIS